MKLRRITVEHFRKLGPRHEIGPIEDGLIVLAGDNEEGKSTILAALKAALFEHYTVGGAVREAMQPHQGGDPFVALEFDMNGGRYSLEKTFKRTGGVRLETPEGAFRDDEAERRLQALLRFERRQGRAEAQPRHHGLQSVFWVDQGTTFDGSTFDAFAGLRARLGGAVATEIDALGSEHTRRLVALVNSRAGEYWTEGERDVRASPAKLAEQELADIDREIAELAGRRRTYDAKVDELARLREKRRLQAEADEAGAARRRLAGLETAHAEARRLEDALKAARAERDNAVQARKALEERRERREQQQEAIAAEEKRLEGLRRTLEDRLGERETVASQARRTETEVKEATAAIERLKLAVHRIDLAEARAEREEERRRLADDLGRARSAREEARQLRASVETARATRPAMERLREAHRNHREALIALRHVATRIEFDPGPEGRVLIDGAEHAPSSALDLVEDTELELRPFGRIRVVPGGGDVRERREAVRRAEATLKEALDAVSEAGLDAAERAHDRLTQQTAALREQEREVAQVCQRYKVDDPEELADALSRQEAGIAALDEELEALNGRDDLPSAPKDGLARELETQEKRRKEAVTLAAEFNRRLGELDGTIAGERGRIGESEGRLDEEKRRLAREREALDEAGLAATLETAIGEERRKVEAVANLEARRDRDGPEALESAIALERRRIDELETEQRRLDDRIRELEGELRGLGEGEHGERLAALEAARPAAEALARRERRTADAWLLLKRTLKEAEKARREALVAPVKARVAPLLARLFPEAEPVLDAETMGLARLARGGVEESFTALSVGTREQVSVLVRLALAQLLKEREGEASCLVLDDALVYADELRFDTMKRILDQAARELQILVLTCRPRDYAGLGRAIHLEDCRST